VKVSKVILMLTMVLNLQSCKDNENQYIEYYQDTGTTEQVSAAPNFKLKCLSGSCPEYISHLRIGTNSACTGVLIEKDLLLTNLHCLKSLRNKNDCSSIKMYFQKANQTFERTCSEIVAKGKITSSHFENNRDYALLKLNKSIDLEVASIDKGNKLNHRDYISTYVTDSQTYNYATISKLTTCNFLKDTIYEKSKDFWFFKDCKIKSGNSGSPILINGKLKGLITSRINQHRSIIRGLFQRDLTPPTNVNYGMGFNVDCIDHENFQAKDCKIKEDREAKIDKVTRLFLKSLKPFNNIINDDYISWKYDLTTLVTTPICIKNVEHLKIVIKDSNSFLENLTGKKVHEYQNSFRGFKPKLSINSELQFEIKMKKENSQLFSQISIDLKNLKKEGYALITFRELLLSSFRQKQISIPVCDVDPEDLNSYSLNL